MKPIDPDDMRDDGLSEAFRNAPFPATPSFAPWELVRAHRRRRIRLGSFTGLLLAAIATFTFWLTNYWTDQVNDVAQGPLPAAPRVEMDDLEVLFATPPVDALDQLEAQQGAFLLAIREFELE
jgi:hypothetical protein